MSVPLDLHHPFALSHPSCGAEAVIDDPSCGARSFDGFLAAAPEENCLDLAGRVGISESGAPLCCLADRGRVERIRTQIADMVREGAQGILIDRPDAWWNRG